MKKISTLLASLPLITTACSSGGSDPVNTTTNQTSVASVDLSQLKGIWSDTGIQTYTSPSGKITTFQAPTALVTSQEDMIILTGNSELYISERGSNKTHFFTSFAYSTEVIARTSLLNGKFNITSFNPKRSANSTLSISADGHYDLIMDMNSLNGTWTDSYATGSTWAFTIGANATGGFTASRNGGCSATGSFSNINSNKNELSVNVSFNGCSPLVGSHTGFAWPDETNSNVLNVAVYSALDTSGKAIGWKLNKSL
jgi:hypothetical protein